MAKLKIPFRDNGGDRSTAVLNVADAISDLNLTSLFGAVTGVSIGAAGQSVLATEEDKDAGPGGTPVNKFAQREMKYIARYTDTVTLKDHSLEIPCGDLNLLSGGTEFMDLTAGAGLDLKTNWDSFVQAPETGNATVLNSVQFVGRNL